MVRAVYSVGDVLVSAGHGEWLAQHVPGCEVVREQASATSATRTCSASAWTG